MNSNTLEIPQIAQPAFSESKASEALDATIRELAELELVCVGGGSGDVIF